MNKAKKIGLYHANEANYAYYQDLAANYREQDNRTAYVGFYQGYDASTRLHKVTDDRGNTHYARSVSNTGQAIGGVVSLSRPSKSPVSFLKAMTS